LSSILKALQRLQGDRGDGALPEPQPALGDELARELAKGMAPEEEARRFSRARLTLLGVAAGTLLLTTAGFGWWLARGIGPEAALSAEAAAPPLAGAEAPEPAPPSGTIRAARPARPSASPEEAPTLPASVEPGASAEVAAAPDPGAPPKAAPPAASPAPAPAAHSAAPATAPAPPRARGEVPRIELAPEAPERAESAPAAAAPAQASPARAPAVAAAPRAEPRAGLAPPAVEVLRTTWHPHPDRRVARIRIAGFAAPLEVREGDAVSTLVVKTIEPSGVLFLHGGEELRRGIGKP
jgi:hypothetical protein